MVSAYARVTVGATEPRSGEVVASVSLDRVRGFAPDSPMEAGEDALRKAAEQAADQLMPAIHDYVKRKERRIEVRQRGLPSLTEYRRAEALLASQRWVSGVAAGAFATNESVIVLTYPEKITYLATRLGREPRFQVVEFDRDRVVAEFRP